MDTKDFEFDMDGLPLNVIINYDADKKPQIVTIWSSISTEKIKSDSKLMQAANRVVNDGAEKSR